MRYRPRTYYTESQKALMWERWQKGDSLQQIAHLFDRTHSSVQGILVRTGGIRPAPRHRSRLALTLTEREEVSRALAAGHSIRSIASLLGRAPSTISREIQRNGGQQWYRANEAEQAAWDRAQRPKTCKLVKNRSLASVVAGKLQSPVVAGADCWMAQAYLCRTMRLIKCHTRPLHRSLFIQARGALKKELSCNTCGGHEPCAVRAITPRRPALTAESLTQCRSASVPATTEDRALPGHWEGDLLFGDPEQPDCDTLVERHTRYVDAGEGRQQRYRDGHQCLDQECAQVAAGALSIADVGSR